MKRQRIKRPKATRPRPKAHPPAEKPAEPPPPKLATPDTGWMGPSFDDGMAAVQNAQQRARFIAAMSGGASPPFPQPGMPPDAPPTTPVEVRTGGPLEITAGEFG